MGVSRLFGCFQDPEARASRKKRKLAKGTQDESNGPGRVIPVEAANNQTKTTASSIPHPIPVPAAVVAAVENEDAPPRATEDDDEPEPWTMGAVARRLSQLQPQLDQARKNREADQQPVREQEFALMQQLAAHGNGYVPRSASWVEETGIRAGDLYHLPKLKGRPAGPIRIVTEEEEIETWTRAENENEIRRRERDRRQSGPVKF
jgi:hypothetical protein